MNGKSLKGRIERVELERSPPLPRPMVITPREGESELDLERRIRAAGGPVAVMPQPCKTTEEWLVRYSPIGTRDE